MLPLPLRFWQGMVQTMSIVKNLNIFKMGSVVELFQGVSIWWMLALVTTTLISVVVFYTVHSLVTKFWWAPLQLRKIMEQQGWKGPKFCIFVGNMPEIFKFRKRELSKDLGIRNFDIMSRVYPQYVLFSKKYGNKVFYNRGPDLVIMVTNPNLVKEILLDVGNYDKPSILALSALAGKSLLTMNGEEWGNHRQIFAPAFRVEILKGLVNKIMKSITSRLDIWEEKVQDGGGLMELEVHPEICIITMAAISYMLFGIIDQKTQQVFIQLKTLFETVSQATTNPFFIMPGYSILPTTNNRKMVNLAQEIDKTIKQIIEIRHNQEIANKTSYGDDLLGLMLKSMNGAKVGDIIKCQLNIQDIFNECKSFFLGGFETTSTFITWTMLLLAEYPEWQDHARTEILEVCGPNIEMDTSKLNRMKNVGMILNEVHRLLPVLPRMLRVATNDTKLGDIFVPKGLILEIPTIQIHQNPTLWGEDAMEFNPNRFAKGVSKACQDPQGFIPFSFGPRYCIGQNLAMLQSKLIVAKVLSRFQLSVSPNYIHNPQYLALLTAKLGVQLHVTKLPPSISS
ncbi:hypothetical protein CY35_05G002100 [Sphagnum magellanicum]|nr:hypothetical protein CY35_05G002100 [Sphagnum magellanicum]